ncbi:MAG: SHOCT domain-containing protein [Planctomycetes bacterium]|nr:SHOCT domain-containing protein [Planctomycetota bacterium]
MAPNTYYLSRVDQAGVFGNAESMTSDVLGEATQFAQQRGKVAIPITLKTSPSWPGHFATVQYQFRLVDKDSPEAQKAALLPVPNVRIETPPAAVPPNQSKDVYAELIKLDDLRKRGVLTEAEFEAQKKKLLEDN